MDDDKSSENGHASGKQLCSSPVDAAWVEVNPCSKAMCCSKGRHKEDWSEVTLDGCHDNCEGNELLEHM